MRSATYILLCRISPCFLLLPHSNLIIDRWKGRRPRRDQRTWRERRQKEFHAWESLIDPLADAYIKWKFGSAPTASDDVVSPPADAQQDTTPEPDAPSHDSVDYTLKVFELFSLEETLTVHRPASSTSVAVDLAEHGFLAKTPILPYYAIGFRTLELYHRLRLRKPSFSVEAFTRVLCDYYKVYHILLRSLGTP